MADGTHIEWTDATWSPVTGCSVVSPGCTNCYAMRLAGTRLAHHPSRAGLTIDTKAGPVWNGQVRLNEEWLTQPLGWKKPRRIFVCAHGDLFHESVPDVWIDRIFAVMSLVPQHTFQVLTKRSARMRDYIAAASALDETGQPALNVRAAMTALASTPSRREMAPVLKRIPLGKFCAGGPWPLPNVWLGVSAEDQARADERIPDLLGTPAAVRWVSAEPMLGPIDLFQDGDGPLLGREPTLRQLCRSNALHFARYGASRLDWIVVGGESGPGARPMHPAWARTIRDQCAAADVPFFFKQHGEWLATADDNGSISYGGHKRHGWDVDGLSEAWAYRVGKKAAGRLLDGVEHNGYPQFGGQTD